MKIKNVKNDLAQGDEVWVLGHVTFNERDCVEITFEDRRQMWVHPDQEIMYNRNMPATEIPLELEDYINWANSNYTNQMPKVNMASVQMFSPDLARWVWANQNTFLMAMTIGNYVVKRPEYVVRLKSGSLLSGITSVCLGEDGKIAKWGNNEKPLRFKNKDKAKAVALLADGTVEEYKGANQ